MRFRDPYHPTADELRAWAYDAAGVEPHREWDLILSWQMERGLLARCVEYAADPECPKAGYFLGVLYHWVDTVARGERYEALHTMYDDWLDVARGVADAKVKRWRHQARLVFQNVKPFDREKWRERWFEALNSDRGESSGAQ